MILAIISKRRFEILCLLFLIFALVHGFSDQYVAGSVYFNVFMATFMGVSAYYYNWKKQ